ncbi:MAG: SH3 domain-containing protein [Roseburia sp.]|nr:SH3 domain-containing protein [Roseburia sp.]
MDNKNANQNTSEDRKQRRKKETAQPARRAIRQSEKRSLSDRLSSALEPRNLRMILVTALKILLPVAACVVVVAAIVSFIHMRGRDESQQSGNLMDEPLAKNEYADVNTLMGDFYKALADGDKDTVMELRDYNDEMAIITYDKKSEFIESYDDVTCYTKSGMEEGSYFVYVTYMVKIEGIDTKAPGLNAFYVYPDESGKLKIDGAMEQNVEASLKLVTSQEDVVDLYTRIDVSYKEALAADEQLNAFMKELPVRIKNEVGEALALAQLEQQGNGDASVTDLLQSAAAQVEGLGDANGAGAGAAVSDGAPEEQGAPEASAAPQEEEALENKTVNQIVRATATVNVRSSDSEEADRIGRVAEGTELTRLEERINGWSKVLFEGKEAYIKSDYLEVLSTEAEGDAIRTVKATTNVNVRNDASQSAAKLGVAQAGNSYDLLEDLGEWYKINYNGQNGYVKAEFFE